MAFNVNTENFSINRFWEKTPTPLKYILLLTIIIASSYFLVTRKINNNEINKIEKGTDNMYEFIRSFEQYQVNQNAFNEHAISNIKNIYSLLNELNNNENLKIDYVIQSSNIKSDKNLIDKINLLNKSSEQLLEAYKFIEINNTNIINIKNEK